MAPKRKRNEQQNHANDENHASPRPSPHRPQNLNMAHQNQHTPGGRNNRRASGRHHNRVSANNSPQPSPATSMPPPLKPAADTPQPTPSSTVQASVGPSGKIEKTSKPVSSEVPAAPAEPAWITTLPFDYDIVTDDHITQWSDSGRELILAEGLKRIRADNLVDTSEIMQEIMRSAMVGRLGPVEAGELLRDILKEDPNPNDAVCPTRHFVDCFATMTEPGLPNPPVMLEFLKATGVDPTYMREQFEASLLIQLGMVRQTFTQMGTRQTTNTLYKLPTYNLLREDTEGYSKLISEYYHCAEQGAPTAERVSDMFQKVKALIGAFNLDSGRALDVTLDVFGDLLIKRHRFFVRYLRASSFWPQQQTVGGFQREEHGFSSLPWWTALDYEGGYLLTETDKARLLTLKAQRDVKFWNRAREVGMQAWFELGGRRAIKDTASNGSSAVDESQPQDKDDHEWIAATGTFPPLGNKMAAQLLGFKLRYYSSDHRGNIQLPENLIWLAALLIHIGFISLKDLYPHLHPSDDAMPEVKLALQREHDKAQKLKTGSGSSKLGDAPPLSDDTVPPPRVREPPKKSPLAPEAEKPVVVEASEDVPTLPPRNQKILLVESLLLIGALPEALFIIGKFPWILEYQPDIMKYILRIIDLSISRVYAATRPLAERTCSITSPRNHCSEQTGLPRGHLTATQAKSRRALKWGRLEVSDSTEAVDYKFYWDDWADNIPICQSVDDVFTLCRTFASLAGARMGENCELLNKLARIGIHSINNDDSDVNKNRWLDLCKRFLAPALSFTESNPGPINQIWELLRIYPITARYDVYAEWNRKSRTTLTHMSAAREVAKSQTSSLLKRISKENTKEMARALAKVSMASPGQVFEVILQHIESYDNLIAVVIECARYFPGMCYDVLTWAILNSVRDVDRQSIQDDGMLTSQWLRQLSAFAAEICKRYSVMSPSPLLRYLANELALGRIKDLELLVQILSSMAGIKTELSYDANQLQYLTGGPEVCRVVYEKFQDKRFRPPGSAQRLMKSLQESKITANILIAIAQERQVYISRPSTETAPLKVVASNLDKIHGSFVQYLDTLRFNMSNEDFESSIPSLPRLIKDFGLQVPIAFYISRNGLRQKLVAHRAETREALKSEKSEGPSAGGDVQMADAISAVETGADKSLPLDVDVTMSGSPPETIDVTTVSAVDRTHPVVQSLAEELRGLLRANFEDAMSIHFYIWFWQLESYDIHYPKDTYTAEQDSIRIQVSKIANDRLMNIHTKNSKKEDLMRRQQILIDETRLQMLQNTIIKRELRQEKDQWFSHLPLNSFKELSENILQDCIIPRAMLSPQDAFYSAKFIFLMHGLGAIGFRTIIVIDSIFRQNLLVNLIFQCTTREVENLGWFLNELLAQLNRWHTKSNAKGAKSPEDLYNQEAFGSKKNLPGFCKKILPETSTPDSPLPWEEYRRLLHKWHNCLYKTIDTCLNFKEYMYIRNAIVLLKIIQSQFPRVNYMGNKLMESITIVRDTETRADLKLSAQSLLIDMKKKQKDWILPQAFQTPRAAAQLSGTATPVSLEGAKALNPTVPAFKPPEIPSTELPAPLGEQEDGEVDDKTNTTEKSQDAHAPKIDQPKEQEIVDIPSAVVPLGPAAQSKVSEHDRLPHKVRGSDRVAMNGQVNALPLVDARRIAGHSAPHLPPHALPNKPEGQIPNHNRPARHSAGPERAITDVRGAQVHRESQYSRLSEVQGPRGGNRMAEDSNSQTRQYRDPRDIDQSRNAPLQETEPRPEVRHSRAEQVPRDRGFDLSRVGPEVNARQSYNQTHRPGQDVRVPAVPPKQDPRVTAHLPREPLVNTERSPVIESVRNAVPERRPDRAVNDRNVNNNPDEDRSDRGPRMTRPSRHDQSREEGMPNLPQPQADARLPGFVVDRVHGHERGHPSDYPRGLDHREDQVGHPPSGPRSDRHGRHDANDIGGRSHDLFQSNQQSRPSIDQNHGRLTADGFNSGSSSWPAQDANYGRLSAGQESAPQGPRAGGPPSRQGGRNFTAPIARNQPSYAPQGTESQALMASVHYPRESQRYAHDSADTRAIMPTANAPMSNPSIAASNAIGIHPSRLEHMEIDTSAPVNQHLPMSPSYPPSGPRNRQSGSQNTTAQSSIVSGAPTGPMPAERRPGSTRTMLSTVNNVLQQTGPTRGRSARNHSNGPANMAASPIAQNYGGPAPQPDRHDEQRHAQISERPSRSSHLSMVDSLDDRSDGNRTSKRREPNDRNSSQRHKSRSPRRDRGHRVREDPSHRPGAEAAITQPRNGPENHNGPRNLNLNSGPPSEHDPRNNTRGFDRTEHGQDNSGRPEMNAREPRSGIPRPYQQPVQSQSRFGESNSGRVHDSRQISQSDIIGQRVGPNAQRPGVRNSRDQDAGRDSSRSQYRHSDGSRKRRGGGEDGSGRGSEAKKPRRD